MRRNSARDRLHAAIVALTLLSTSVSIVVAGTPADGTTADMAAHAEASSAEAPASSLRSFTDMIAEAAREQERLSAATPSEECIGTVETGNTGTPAPSSVAPSANADAGIACAGAQQTSEL